MDHYKQFQGIKVLVIGDVMLDRYWWGNVSRISPEAPVPVVKMNSSSLRAGGAANVAANLSGLGAIPLLVGIIGDDAEGRALPSILREANVSGEYLVKLSARPTTVKTRIIAHGQQVARIDQECDDVLSKDDQSLVRKLIEDLIVDCDVVLCSDYAKGLLSESLAPKIIARSREIGKKVLVDPKGRDYRKYGGATLLTPNRREAIDACGFDENNPNVVAASGKKLLKDLSLDAILVTEGEDGMTLFRADGSEHHLHTHARKVFDVTGAGDTVIATMAAAVGAGLDLVEAAVIANMAAGLVVETVGTTAITIDMLRAGEAS
ncbi:MAG: D-glycero-beta-D-manno-heptose-7-phosphate kinase [Acidobacteriota bacterium]